jgi:putative FmdB family regulatory protein
MPLYEYECEACGHRFELIQKFSDAPADTCPVCGGSVQKLPSSPAFQFKGTGWYVTDYARKGGPDGGTTAGKTEAKPSEPKTSESSTSGSGKPEGKGTSSSGSSRGEN